MQVAVFSAKRYDIEHLERANVAHAHDFRFLESRLDLDTVLLAGGAEAVCVFVNDDCSEPVLGRLAENGTRMLALRSAGYNHVDLEAARRLGLTVARVPAYSPHAVAEFTVGMILALDRQ